jgi:aspartyl-tRNA(Asn)/glutamyl-tRNA(Gln) amidotransferase subunit B
VKAILARSSDSSKTLPRLPVLLDELGLRSMPADALEGMCKAAIEKLPREAESVRKGKVKVIMRLVGEVMQQSKGRADAVKAKAVLERLLGI